MKNAHLMAQELLRIGQRNVPEDKHLVYVNPRELQVLERMSGKGEPDPVTKIPHFDEGPGGDGGYGGDQSDNDSNDESGTGGMGNGPGGPGTGDVGGGGISAADQAALDALTEAGLDNPAVDPNDPDQAPTDLSEADMNAAALAEASQAALGHATLGNEGLGMGPDQASPGIAGENGWTDTNFSQAFQNQFGKENSNLNNAKAVGQMLSILGYAGVPSAGMLGGLTGLGVNVAGALGYGNYNNIAGNLSNSKAAGSWGESELSGPDDAGNGTSDDIPGDGSVPGTYSKPVVSGGGGPGFREAPQLFFNTEVAGKAKPLALAMNEYVRNARGPSEPLTSGLLNRKLPWGFGGNQNG